ncbi:hypothetical protein [Amycolatopsis anabasis]|uniref:hypothetical protein n=1 Tax=Amycolatopsis anabasis TaxID=1840409 RepID=UPI00131D110B|nr:hypothetical protein [Amycolatopsis anabasis]
MNESADEVANNSGQPETPVPAVERAAEEGRRVGEGRSPVAAVAPIVGEHHVGRFEFFYRRPPVKAWTARVFVQASGRCLVFMPDRQPTTRELLWSGIRTMYEIDLAYRHLAFEIDLPSTGDAFAFQARVDMQWRVTDPLLVVRDGITDIRRVLLPSLLADLRRATRRCRIADAEKAECEANREVADDALSRRHGLWTKVFVRLRMDDQWRRNVRLEAQVGVYRAIIAMGDLNQFALQLAQNPKDVEPVVRALASERDLHRREVFDFIARLIESEALDRWEIDDQVREALRWLKDSIHRVISGTDEARQFSAGPEGNGSPPGRVLSAPSPAGSSNGTGGSS